MPAPPSLPTTHAPGELVLATDIDDIAAGVNTSEQLSHKGAANGYAGLGATGLVPPAQLGAGTASSVTALHGDGVYRVPAGGGSSSTGWQSGVGFKAMFGALDREFIPNAAKLTEAAIAGTFDQSPTVAGLSEAATSLATQFTGVASGQTVTLLPGIYREAITVPVTNVTVRASGDVSWRGSDVWGASVWATAPAPNAAAGIISDVSHLVPAFTVETDIGQFTGGVRTIQASPEQVFVDGVMYNRKADNAALGLGEWCLNNSTAGAGQRRVIIYMAGGIGGVSGHKIEVTTRQTWIATSSNGVTVDGIDFRHCASLANTAAGFQSNSKNDIVMQNCMVSYCHGLGSSWGSASGGRCTNTVFANNGTIGIDTNSEVPFVGQGCVFFNNGGTNRRYGGGLDGDGYDYHWGSGGIKIVGDSGVITGCFAFNNGFAAYWHDVYCRYGAVTNNVGWDNRGIGIHYEASGHGEIGGNRVFQTNSSQFITATDGVGIYMDTSRVTNVHDNLVMRYSFLYKNSWDRLRLPNTPKVLGTGVASVGNGTSVTYTMTNTLVVGQAVIVTGSSQSSHNSPQAQATPMGTTGEGMNVAARTGTTFTINTPVSGSGTGATVMLHALDHATQYNNEGIARKAGGGLATSDQFWQWTDAAAGVDIADATNSGGGNLWGWEGYSEDSTTHQTVWPQEFLWYSSLVTNQNGGGFGNANYWVNDTTGPGSTLIASRWESGTGPDTSKRVTRFMTAAEITERLLRYGLPLGN